MSGHYLSNFHNHLSSKQKLSKAFKTFIFIHGVILCYNKINNVPFVFSRKVFFLLKNIYILHL